MVQIKLKGVIGVESPSPRSFWCGLYCDSLLQFSRQFSIAERIEGARAREFLHCNTCARAHHRNGENFSPTVPVSSAAVAVCCSVLQCVAVCCSVLQCVAVCCITRELNFLRWYLHRQLLIHAHTRHIHTHTHIQTDRQTHAHANIHV